MDLTRSFFLSHSPEFDDLSPVFPPCNDNWISFLSWYCLMIFFVIKFFNSLSQVFVYLLEVSWHYSFLYVNHYFFLKNIFLVGVYRSDYLRSSVNFLTVVRTCLRRFVILFPCERLGKLLRLWEYSFRLFFSFPLLCFCRFISTFLDLFYNRFVYIVVSFC